jgi:phosphoribosylformylglycinamidine synthase
VQVGDPFTEKLLIEACLELMAEDAIVAIQDMGAAGLTSSSFEMAARGDCGIELDLDWVPLRETGMTAYEIMLSESQERMLMVLREGREPVALRIFAKWGLDCATIGRVTDSGRMILRHHGAIVADLPVAPIAGSSPVYDRPHVPTAPPLPILANDQHKSPLPVDEALLRLLACPDLADKSWIWEQYDDTVGADTAQGPGGDAAVVRIQGTERALALTTDCTPRYCQADPVRGGAQAVAEAWRNLCAVGARPLAITNCLNFGNPQRAPIMGQLVGCLDGMAQACRALDFPVVSGNVSLYNETDGQAILPTPQIGGVGLLDDVERRVGLALPRAGLALVLVGESYGWLGASLFLREVLGREDGAPPPVELGHERRNGEFVRTQIRVGRVVACHDLADGGLAVAVAEMAIAGGVGAVLAVPEGISAVGWLFGEEQGRYVLAVEPGEVDTLIAVARTAGVIARPIGRSGGETLTIAGAPPISFGRLRDAQRRWLRDWVEEPG